VIDWRKVFLPHNDFQLFCHAGLTKGFLTHSFLLCLEKGRLCNDIALGYSCRTGCRVGASMAAVIATTPVNRRRGEEGGGGCLPLSKRAKMGGFKSSKDLTSLSLSCGDKRRNRRNLIVGLE
jgi:hypothetical protein